jgi:hypothetical protein
VGQLLSEYQTLWAAGMWRPYTNKAMTFFCVCVWHHHTI